jgi:hypothetical protein
MMDFLTFLSKALDSWPLATIIIIVLLKNKIDIDKFIALVLNFKKFKLGNFEAELKEQMADAKEAAKEVTSIKPPQAFESEKEKLLRIGEISPRGAIMEAWIKIELSLYKLFSEINQEDDKYKYRNPSPLAMVNELYSSNIIGKGELVLLKDLVALRNKASHDYGEIPFEIVDDYIELALNISAVLEYKTSHK